MLLRKYSMTTPLMQNFDPQPSGPPRQLGNTVVGESLLVCMQRGKGAGATGPSTLPRSSVSSAATSTASQISSIPAEASTDVGAPLVPVPSTATEATQEAGALTAAQAEDVLSAWVQLRDGDSDGSVTVHGWQITYKLRPPPAAGRHDSARHANRASWRTGDFVAHAPSGERVRSFQGVQKALGVEYRDERGRQRRQRGKEAVQQPKAGSGVGDEELFRSSGLDDEAVFAAAAAAGGGGSSSGLGPSRPPPIAFDKPKAKAARTAVPVFIVARLLQRRWRGSGRWRKEQFLVRWKGYGPADDTWEDASNIIDKRLVDELDGKSPKWSPPGGKRHAGAREEEEEDDEDDEDDEDEDDAAVAAAAAAAAKAAAKAAAAAAKRSKQVAAVEEDGDHGDDDGDDDDDDDDDDKSGNLCGTFGCTLPDKHAGLHRIPDHGARERRPRRASPSPPRPPKQPRLPKPLALGMAAPPAVSAGAKRHRHPYLTLSPSKKHSPSALASPVSGGGGFGGGEAQAAGWAKSSPGGGRGAGASDEDGEDEDEDEDEDGDYPIGPDYQAEVPEWVEPTVAADGSSSSGGGGGAAAGTGTGSAAAAPSALSPASRRQRGEPAEPTRIDTRDIGIQAAQALAQKLTRVAYLEGHELSLAMRGAGGDVFSAAAGGGAYPRGGGAYPRGGGRSRAVAAASAAFPRDFFKYLHRCGVESDDGDDDESSEGGSAEGSELSAEAARRQARAKPKNNPNQRTEVVVRLVLSVSSGGVLCGACEADDDAADADAEAKPDIGSSSSSPTDGHSGSSPMDVDAALEMASEEKANVAQDGAPPEGHVDCALRLVTRRFKMCGTMGCQLPDRHSGLHILPEIEPRKRLPAPAAVMAVAMAHPPPVSRRRSKEPSAPPAAAAAAPPPTAASTASPVSAAAAAAANILAAALYGSAAGRGGSSRGGTSGRGGSRGSGGGRRGGGRSGAGRGNSRPAVAPPPEAGAKRARPAINLGREEMSAAELAAIAASATASAAEAKATAEAKLALAAAAAARAATAKAAAAQAMAAAKQAGQEAVPAVLPAAMPASKPANTVSKRSRGADGAGVYTVDRLIERRWAGTRWQYLVRWEHFSEAHDTWEDERNIIDPELLEDFHRTHASHHAPSPLAEMPLAVVP